MSVIDLKARLKELEVEKKWLEVQAFYSEHYPKQFKLKEDDRYLLKDDDVLFLWSKMHRYYENMRDNIDAWERRIKNESDR